MNSPVCTRLSASTEVYSFYGGGEASHLIVSGNLAILMDCHDASLATVIAAARLPLPSVILHTHIAPEHCREGQTFGDAAILVHEPDAVLACDSAFVRETLARQQADLANWGALFGRELFSIAGCQTDFPPRPPLPGVGTFRLGEVLHLGDLALQVIDLPFHGRHPVGFLLLDAEARPLAVFPGDLLMKGGYLVDAISTLENYVTDRFERLPALLEHVRALGALPLFPATGAPIADPQEATEALTTLAGKMERFLATRRRVAPLWVPPEPRRVLGRFAERAPGIYQLNQFGNAIVLIQEEGHALMVDPGPCDYDNPEREAVFLADLTALEASAGLKHLDLILMTHYHGDHVDLTRCIKTRYPEARVATWDAVADVLESPDAFTLSAKLPWYGLREKTVPVDQRLALGPTLEWRGTPIEVIHLPGHALAHCGFILPFRGLRLAITGDSVQIRDTPDTLNLAPTNNAQPTGCAGNLGSYLTLLSHEIDLNLGGHSSFFTGCRAMYEASLRRIEAAHAALEPLFQPGRLSEAYLMRQPDGERQTPA